MITKAEQIIMDYTASTKWSQIKHMTWTTAEVMDVFDTYFKNQNPSHNSDKTICCNNCRNISRCKLAWKGSDWNLSTDYCSKHHLIEEKNEV